MMCCRPVAPHWLPCELPLGHRGKCRRIHQPKRMTFKDGAKR